MPTANGGGRREQTPTLTLGILAAGEVGDRT
jgi:hypothetical protein